MQQPQTRSTSNPPLIAVNETDSFAVHVIAGGHRFIADEPAPAPGPAPGGSQGDEPHGSGLGPDPFSLLLGALASCILITLRMYARRKQWPLVRAQISLTPTRAAAAPLEAVDIELELDGPLSEEQRIRLLDIAGRCPVHRTIESSVRITSRLAP